MNNSEAITCCACGSNNLRDLGPCRLYDEKTIEWLSSYKGVSRDSGRLYHCKVCGSGMRWPHLSEEQLESIYQHTEEGTWEYEFNTNTAWVRARELLVERIGSSKECRILDIGCNEGMFLSELPVAWKKYGIEPSINARRVLQNRGIKVIGDSLDELPSEWHGQFDAVCLFDVFEHVPEPVATIRAALRYLRPNGCLILSTGAIDTWPWKVLKGQHWYLQTPLHLSFGSSQFFQWYCKKNNIKLVSSRYISHRVGSFKNKLDDAVATFYFFCRLKGGLWNAGTRLIHALPGYRSLLHVQAMPYTVYLRDHVLVQIEK